MNLLFDTHTFLWWDSAPDKLSRTVLSLCEDPDNILFLSVASAWEIKIKESLGKLSISNSLEKLIDDQIESNGIKILKVDLPHIYALDDLPHHHSDPFDRLIIAQALLEKLKIMYILSGPRFALKPNFFLLNRFLQEI